MSGGVDSAVCAYLLKKEGYDVTGVTLRTWESDTGEESRCCEIEDARMAAESLGIPFFTFNCCSEFEAFVSEPFMKEYLEGKTPNPCVVCNRAVKWDRLIYHANVLGADFVATGHYARIKKTANGRYTVQRGLHSEKDQSYMLYRLSQEQLSRTLMPLGGLSKDEVRKIAADAGLHVAGKADSQEICFVTDGSYAEYIEKNYEGDIPGEGCFVDEEGNVLGKHRGIVHYTVGQRRGLDLAMGYPVYVKRIDAEKNEVVVSRDEDLYSDTVLCSDLSFLSIEGLKEGEKMRCFAKIRYRHEARPAEISMAGEGLVRIVFDEPVRAAAPGQSAVFYDGDGCVIGGGVIEALPGSGQEKGKRK